MPHCTNYETGERCPSRRPCFARSRRSDSHRLPRQMPQKFSMLDYRLWSLTSSTLCYTIPPLLFLVALLVAAARGRHGPVAERFLSWLGFCLAAFAFSWHVRSDRSFDSFSLTRQTKPLIRLSAGHFGSPGRLIPYAGRAKPKEAKRVTCRVKLSLALLVVW
jgi:hypothetical protein